MEILLLASGIPEAVGTTKESCVWARYLSEPIILGRF